MTDVVRYSDSDLCRIFGAEVPPAVVGLLEVDLPREVDVLFEAYPVERVGLPAELSERLGIGRAWHGACEVQVDLGDGSVWSVVAVDGGQPEVTFMNSDLKRFIIFLQQVHGMALLAEVEDGSRYRERAGAVSRQLAQADVPATREGAWWAGILWEMVEMA